MLGYFGYVGSGGEVRNLGLENVQVSGRECGGGLVGRLLWHGEWVL